MYCLELSGAWFTVSENLVTRGSVAHETRVITCVKQDSPACIFKVPSVSHTDCFLTDLLLCLSAMPEFHFILVTMQRGYARVFGQRTL